MLATTPSLLPVSSLRQVPVPILRHQPAPHVGWKDDSGQSRTAPISLCFTGLNQQYSTSRRQSSASRIAVVARPRRCYLWRMNLEELADLIRANSANTNGRIDGLRSEVNATLMNIQNDFTDVRGDIKVLRADVADVKQSLDLATVVADLRRQVEVLVTEVADLKRRAS